MTKLTVVPIRYAKKRNRIASKPRKPKQTAVGLKRLWNVPEKAWMRYTGIKGIYWFWFSRYIRERDVKMFWVCISCGRPITVESSDAGHFMPAQGCGRDLLFDERNVNAECSRCNAFDDTHLLGYAEGLDKRYGEGTAKGLRFRMAEYKAGLPLKDWKASEYEEKIRALPSYQQSLTP